MADYEFKYRVLTSANVANVFRFNIIYDFIEFHKLKIMKGFVLKYGRNEKKMFKKMTSK
jgi:hypothetical protein